MAAGDDADWLAAQRAKIRRRFERPGQSHGRRDEAEARAKAGLAAAFASHVIPFWEERDGNGRASRLMAGRDRALDAQQDHKLKLLDPRVVTDGTDDILPKEVIEQSRQAVRELTGMMRGPISGRTYKERRAAKLCQTCEATSPEFARCDECRRRYNALPCREKFRTGKR